MSLCNPRSLEAWGADHPEGPSSPGSWDRADIWKAVWPLATYRLTSRSVWVKAKVTGGWLVVFWKANYDPIIVFLSKCKLFIHSLKHHSEKQVPVYVIGQAESSTCSVLGKGPWPHRWKCRLGFFTDTHVVPSHWSTGGPQRQDRGWGSVLKCFQELCPAVCQPAWECCAKLQRHWWDHSSAYIL